MIKERIRELVEQAEQELANIPKGMFSMPIIITKQKFNERLAELIIKECCDIFVELRTRPADLAVLDVKSHFGVE